MDKAAERAREIEEAFAWHTDYDKVLALAHLVSEKAEQQNLSATDLSEPEQIAFFIPQFDAEIANGGFHQLFTNPLGDRCSELLNTLTRIQADHTAQLLTTALSIFPNSLPPRNQLERSEVLAKCPAAELNRLSELDEAYYQQAESIFALAAEYLRGHKPSFL
jgi:hypothetical protein